MAAVKYSTAVARLQTCAADLDRLGGVDDDRLLVEAWVFGELLEFPQQLDVISRALVVDLPAEDVTWYAQPPLGEAMTSFLRFDKYPLRWLWRPSVSPNWNHVIDRAVRFWSRAGSDIGALNALADRRIAEPTVAAPPDHAALHAQVLVEHEAAWQHLSAVFERYADPDWRRAHTGYDLYPDDHLWSAAAGLSTSMRRSDGWTGETGSDARRREASAGVIPDGPGLIHWPCVSTPTRSGSRPIVAGVNRPRPGVIVSGPRVIERCPSGHEEGPPPVRTWVLVGTSSQKEARGPCCTLDWT
jgi:hypothetical protein